MGYFVECTCSFGLEDLFGALQCGGLRRCGGLESDFDYVEWLA